MGHHWGYLGAITAAILFGINATFSKIMLGYLHPLVVSGLIYLTAGIALFFVRISPLNQRILSLLETPTETEESINRRDIRILVLFIFSGAFIAPILFMFGLQATTAVNTSLLLNTEALFTVLIAFIFLKERSRTKDYLGITIILIGAAFVTTAGDLMSLEISTGIFGSLLIIGACLFWGIDNNLSKFICQKRDLVFITALKCLFGGLLLLMCSLFLGIPIFIPMIAIPYLFTVGAFSIGFSILFFLFALREIGAMKTGVIFSTSSLIGAVFATLILNEPFTLIQMVAGVGMLGGIYLLYKEPRQQSRAE